jgi:hypothetical protein
LRETRRFVESRLKDWRGLFDGEPQTVRVEIAKHVQKIALTPEGKTYIASGVLESTRRGGCYNGAGGQNRTGYARLFRAALYH